jgi:ligand-binding sensor domain-containing protein
VRAFLAVRDGTLWMGTAGSGCSPTGTGRFTRLTTAEGLPIDLVRSLYEDAHGHLWVGTEGAASPASRPAPRRAPAAPRSGACGSATGSSTR